jgi:hypothetical protein
MEAHEAFTQLSFKYDNLSDLEIPISSLKLLAEPTTPDEVQEQVIARAENGETFSHAQIKEMIAGAKRKGDAALLRKAGDTDALDLWLKAIRAKKTQETNRQAPELKAAHRPRKPDNAKNDIRVSKYGTDPSYALARLRRDRPDLHTHVLNGEISAHAAMVEDGVTYPARNHAQRASPRAGLNTAPALSEPPKSQKCPYLLDLGGAKML